MEVKGKLRKCFKLLHKPFGLLMSGLMVFSTVNVSGVQNIFAAGTELGYQARTSQSNSSTIDNVWETNNVPAYTVETESARAFSLSLRGNMKDGLYMDRSALAENKGNVRKALNYYYDNPNETNFWIAQTVIWGLEAGKITNYTGDAVKDEVAKVFAKVGIAYNEDTVLEKLNDMASYRNDGTFYVYTYNDEYVQLVSNEDGTKPTAEYGTVSSTQTVNRNEKITVRVNKTDVNTKNPLSGATFEFYKDGVKDETVTTDSQGIAEHTFTEKISKDATAQAQYVVNYSLLSPNNQKLATADGQYSTRALAQEGADTTAYRQAYNDCYGSNTGEHTYKVIETSTKTAYYLNPNNNTFEKALTGNYNADTDNDGTVTFDVTNAPQLGNINITKVDEQNKTGIEGAVYGLYAAETIYHPDGSGQTLYTQDQLVKEFPATDENGAASLSNLYLGNYYIKEIDAPEGYVLSDTQYSVTLAYDGSDKDHVTVNKTVGDKWQTGTINITKTDDETGTAIEGATFDLYARNDIVHPDGKTGVIYKANTKIGTFPATDENGKTTISGLYLGNYYVVETNTASPYYNNKAEKDITISYIGQDEEVSVKEQSITNHRQEGKITITQKDADTGETVPGSIYELYALEDIVRIDGEVMYESGELVGTFPATDQKGQASLDQLYLGKYYVVQKTASDGYIYSENRSEITLDYIGQDANINLQTAEGENTVQRGSISFSKKDTDLYNKTVEASKVDTDNDGAQADATLEGATYGLYAREDIDHKDTKSGPVTYSSKSGSTNEIVLTKGTDLHVENAKATKDTLIATAKTDENGEIEFSNLYLGDYYIKEIEPSEGYKLDDTEYDVSLVYAGQNEDTTSADTTVFENIMKQAFTIYKAGSVPGTNEPLKALKGAHFEVKLESDIQRLVNSGLSLEDAIEQAPLYDELVTDSKGNATSVELPYGTYRVTETVTPKDYNKCDDFFVEITKDSRTPLDFTNSPVINEMFFANLQIVKIDAMTGKTVAKANTEFKVKAITDCYVDGKKINAGEYIGYFTWDITEGFWVDSWTTDSNGYLKLGKTISAGEYQLEEVHAPEGYVLDEMPVRFTVSTDQWYELDENNEPLFKVYKSDYAAKGKITVEKQGNVLTGFEDGQFIYESKGLENAQYQIVAQENIMDPSNDGTILYKEGTVVTTVTTGKDGTVSVSDLPLGKYAVKEIAAPYGFVLNDDIQIVDLKYKDEETPLVTKSVTFENDKQYFDVSGIKLDKETNEAVKGAEFTVYANEDIYSYDGSLIVEAYTPIVVAVSDEYGMAHFDIDLPVDYEFYMLETQAPLGYVSTDQKELFNTNYTNQNDSIVTVRKTFTNAPTTVEIGKEDAVTGVMPEGTEMSILDSNGETVASWITVQGQTHIVKRLHVGEEYTLTEVKAAEGYLKADDIKFTVSDTADVQKYVMKDEQVKGTVTVVKTGEVLTDISKDENGNTTFIYENDTLENAVYKVYAAEDIKHPDNESDDFYKSGDLVATLTTGEDGSATTDKLPLGKYKVVEETAPEGYVINTSEKETALTYKDQLTPVVTEQVDFNNDRQKVEISATKYDSKTNETVQGAEFTLYAGQDILNADGQVLISEGDAIETVTTGKDGTATVKADLPLGQYTMKETKAPIGYNSTEASHELDASYQTQDVQTVKLDCSFTNIPTKVELTKVDASTGVKTEGNIMQLFDHDNVLIDEWTTELDESHYTEYLHVGETYTLVEKLAATGYLKANDITFTVEDKGDSGEVQIVEPMKDEQVKGQITVTKTGEVLKGFEDGQFVYEERNLPGAVFKIYAAEDIVHPDGKTEDFYKAGDLVATLTTGEDGTATTDKLPLGKYTVVESVAPAGMVLDTTEKEVSLVYQDQMTPVVFDSTQCINARQTVTLDINKLDKETNTLLKGAEFTLYANKDIVNYDGSVIVEKGTAIAKAVSDENGKAVFNVDLPIDTDSQTSQDGGNTATGIIGDPASMFYVKETARPNGYASINETVYVDTTYRGQETENIAISFDLFNQQTKVGFTLTDKYTGSFVSGAQLSVIPVDENGHVVEGETFETWITDNSQHIIRGLEPGKYLLRHVLGQSAEMGYVTAKDYAFEVTDTADMQNVDLSIDCTHTSFTLLDEDQQPLTGATMAIVPVGEDGQLLYAETFETWLSDENAHSIDYLPVGNYALVEMTAPEGYVKAQPVYFEVSDTNQLQKFEMINKTVEFAVKDATTDEILSGAEITVKDANGNIVDRWVTDEVMHQISGLTEGQTYTVTEIKASDGYVAALDMSIEVSKDKVSESFEMLNKQLSVSKYDEKDELLSGAELQIINAETQDVIDSWTTEDKVHFANGLRENETYILEEVKAPKGYEIAEPVEFTVSDEKENETVTMKDALILTDVVVTLKDAETDKAITGKDFAFDIYSDEACTKLISSVNADKNSGTVTFKDLPYGTYYIKQKTAPDGYEISTQVVKVVIDENFNGVGDIHNMAIKVSPVENASNGGSRTGDSTNVSAYIAALLMSAAMFFAVKRKKLFCQ